MNAIQTFQSNRENADDYTKTLNRLLTYFIKGDEFVSLPASTRTTIVDCVEELKHLAINAFNEKSAEQKNSAPLQPPDSESDIEKTISKQFLSNMDEMHQDSLNKIMQGPALESVPDIPFTPKYQKHPHVEGSLFSGRKGSVDRLMGVINWMLNEWGLERSKDNVAYYIEHPGNIVRDTFTADELGDILRFLQIIEPVDKSKQ